MVVQCEPAAERILPSGEKAVQLTLRVCSINPRPPPSVLALTRTDLPKHHAVASLLRATR
jgi:hypothetical protein